MHSHSFAKSSAPPTPGSVRLRLAIAFVAVLVIVMMISDLAGVQGSQARYVALGVVALLLFAATATGLLFGARRVLRRSAAARTTAELTADRFVSHAHALWDSAAAAGQAVVGVVVGVDSFQRILDTHGKVAAAHVTRAVAAELDERFATYGVVGRIGPDAFYAMLIVPGGKAPISWAIRLFWQARTSLLAQPPADSDLEVRITGGVIATIPHPRTVTDLISRAHTAHRNARSMNAPIVAATAPSFAADRAGSDA